MSACDHHSNCAFWYQHLLHSNRRTWKLPSMTAGPQPLLNIMSSFLAICARGTTMPQVPLLSCCFMGMNAIQDTKNETSVGSILLRCNPSDDLILQQEWLNAFKRKTCCRDLRTCSCTCVSCERLMLRTVRKRGCNGNPMLANGT